MTRRPTYFPYLLTLQARIPLYHFHLLSNLNSRLPCSSELVLPTILTMIPMCLTSAKGKPETRTETSHPLFLPSRSLLWHLIYVRLLASSLDLVPRPMVPCPTSAWSMRVTPAPQPSLVPLPHSTLPMHRHEDIRSPIPPPFTPGTPSLLPLHRQEW